MSVARALTLASSLAVPLAAAAQDAQPLRIQHQPPQCLVPGRYAELRAKVEPMANVLRTRILFKTDPMAEPHAVTMRQDGQEFVGYLPRPLATAAQVTYWVEATDPALVEVVTDETTVPVQAECAQPAKAVKTARAEVTAPMGAPLVPEGFQPEDAVQTASSRGSKAGVFNIGPATSLVAALAVGGGAVALAAKRNPGDEAESRPREFEAPGVRLIESIPAVGGTVRLGQEGLQLTVRLVIGSGTFGGTPTIEFRQNPGGPICLTQAFTLPNEFLEPNVGRNIQFRQFRSTGACGTTFEVNVARIALTNIQGAVVFGTGTGEVPDLALRYTITP
jgi:hypothetical protein